MNATYRIVVGVDGSEGGDRALRWAAAQAEARGGTVQAVIAWSWDGPTAGTPALATHPDQTRDYAQRLLDDAVRAVTTERPHVAIATETLEGKAATVLTRTATGADLLVLGSHGHGRLHHAVLGSVAEECVRAATCPVVVVPVRLDATASQPAELATT